MHLVLSILLVVFAGCQARTPGPRATVAVEAVKPAVLGHTLHVDSKVLGERRTINVFLPPGYDETTDRYPVLYMPDGGMNEDFPHVVGSVDVSIKNALIRPVIVVGVQNTERRRDLAPVTTVPDEQRIAPRAGGTARFRRFLQDELMPLVAARYRTTDESGLVGESLAGLFVVETFLLEPALFDHYIAADPSLWWNQDALVREHGHQLAWLSGPRTFYVASSAMQDGLADLLGRLRSYAPAGLDWVHEPMHDATHGSLYPTAALHGIRHAFAP